MVTAIQNVSMLGAINNNGATSRPQAYAYRYDQLNRLVSADVYARALDDADYIQADSVH